ncbi:Hypothetical predicted protein [Octopus vulgaris]|uniref:Retinol dehydrogenase 12 n=1 Tax=Octopus vulgaris TaxID=6645 RepID=A0AA36BVP6_OCTVU|nr:Hypothetical predicted protein [Octopus vulgaris]
MSAKAGRIDAESVDAEDIVEDFFSGVVLAGLLATCLLFLFLLRKYIQWGGDCPTDNRIDGKTVIITGGNSGIGRATATELSKRGARVILACRDMKKGDAVARAIRKKTMNPNVFCMRLDLSSLHSVKEFADEFCYNEPQLHVLINNAAYMGPKLTTSDHIEKNFGVNYLGHFYLTKLLVEKLHKNAPSRIINVISDSYQSGKLDFNDLAMHESYGIYRAYARSKMALAILTLELHRRYYSEVIWTFAVHPGAVNTDLLRNWPGMTGNFLRVMSRILFKTPEQGCQTIVYCAVADKVRDHAGKLFINHQAVNYVKRVRDWDMARRLWNVSLHLIGCDDEIEPEQVEEAIHGADTAKQE